MGADCIGKDPGEFGGASVVGMYAVGCADPGSTYGLTPGAIGVHVLDLTREQITNNAKSAFAKPIWAQPIWCSLTNEGCLEVDEHNAIS